MTRLLVRSGMLCISLSVCGAAYGQAEASRVQEAIQWYTGEAGTVDDAKARALLLDVAQTGAPLAQMWVARCHARGRMEFEEDREKANELAASVMDDVRRMAEAGTVEAIFLLGSAYDEGYGVAPDAEQAMVWLHRAGEQGHVLAQHNLGNAYFAGNSVAQNDTLAVRWWRPAAEKGDAIAEYRLGTMYEAGRGVLQNDEQAAYWYRRSARRGLARAREALERLGGC